MQLNLRNPVHLVGVMFMALCISMLGACGTTLQKPVTAQDYVQTAKGQVTAAYKSIGDLKAQGSITGAQATSYIGTVDGFNKNVQLAQTAVDTKGADLTTVQGMLAATLPALLALQADLNTKQKGK